MTNEKPKKKSKLRNAEYYDMQEVLDGLYKDSQKGCTFQRLIPLLLHAKRSETIAKYLRLVNPTESQLAKINKYREFLNLDKIEM